MEFPQQANVLASTNAGEPPHQPTPYPLTVDSEMERKHSYPSLLSPITASKQQHQRPSIGNRSPRGELSKTGGYGDQKTEKFMPSDELKVALKPTKSSELVLTSVPWQPAKKSPRGTGSTPFSDVGLEPMKKPTNPLSQTMPEGIKRAPMTSS